MKNNRWIVFTVLALISALSLAGCGQETASTDVQASMQQTTDASQAQTQDSATATAEENAIYGEVTAVDGSTITLQIGTLNQGRLGEDGAPPSGAGQDNDGAQPSGMPSDMPSGEQPSGMPSDIPSGEQPSGMPSNMPSGGQRPSMLTLTDETKTITIPDESIVTVTGQDSQETGLAAIKVGSTLEVVYAQDGETIASVVVMNGGGFSGGSGGGSTPAAS